MSRWSLIESSRPTRLHFARYWLLYTVMAALVSLFQINYRIGLNLSDSLPYRLYLVRNNSQFERGELIAFKYQGSYTKFEQGAGFIKQITGLPGDLVDADHGEVTVNGQSQGRAVLSPDSPLSVIQAQVIPNGYYFVHGEHPLSFDSRYAQQGLIHHNQITGTVVWKW
jgi:conjugative transfer signal peptidase TraF